MKNSFYFSHDGNAHNDQKILELRSVYGWEGYGLYWAVIELMFNAKDYKLRYDRLNGIALHLNKDASLLYEFIDLCIDLDLFVLQENQLFSKSLVERMLLRANKSKLLSKAGKKGAETRWKNSEANSVANATAIAKDSKERKVKKSKVNKNKLHSHDNTFDKFWEMYDKKVGNKEKIKKKWYSLKADDRLEVFCTLPQFLKTIKDKQYQPYPMTYLNNERWKDDIQTHTAPKTDEEIVKAQELQIKRQNQRQRAEWAANEKKAANSDDIKSIIGNWKQHKGVSE